MSRQIFTNIYGHKLLKISQKVVRNLSKSFPKVMLQKTRKLLFVVALFCHLVNCAPYSLYRGHDHAKGCDENSDLRPRKLRPSGCLENSDPKNSNPPEGLSLRSEFSSHRPHVKTKTRVFSFQLK